MNILRIIKSLFRRKDNSNTSLTLNDNYIRKYNDLSAKEKIKVANEIDKIVTFDFSDIISYTTEQDNKFNYIQDYLINAKRKPLDVNYDPIVNTARKTNSLLIYAGECEIIKKELQEIKNELEIKYHALDTIIKKPSSILRHKKINWFNKLRDNLIEARRKITITIADVGTIIASTDKLIISSVINIPKEIQYQDYTISNDLYRKTLDILVDEVISKDSFNYSDFLSEVKTNIIDKMEGFNSRFSNELLYKIQKYLEDVDTEIKLKVISYYGKLFLMDIAKPNGKLNKLCLTKYLFYKNDPEAWHYLVNELPYSLIIELYKIVAKYTHRENINAYEHRNDYRAYIKEVEDLTNKCLSTPTNKWESSGINIYESLEKFNDNGIMYSKICEAYFTDEVKEQMRAAFARLCWLMIVNRGHISFTTTSLHDKNENIWGDDFDDYYKQYFEELLKKVEEKFDVKFSELKFLGNHIHDREIFSLYRSRELINLLNDSYDKTLFAYPTQELPITYKRKNTNTAITSLGNFLVNIEELYYHLREKDGVSPKFDFSNIEPFSIYNDEQHKIYTVSSKATFYNFVALIQFRQFEKQYDDRILIFPEIYDKDDYWDYIKLQKEKAISAFATDCDKFDNYLLSHHLRSKIKYLFVEESTVAQYHMAIKKADPDLYSLFIEKDGRNSILISGNAADDTTIQILARMNYVKAWLPFFDGREKYIQYDNTKIIVVPDNTSYSELSNILNQELAKNEENTKELLYTR